MKKKNNDKTPATKEIGLQAELTQLRGVYSNLAVISHTDREFIFDFFLRFRDQGQLVSRIVTSPAHAKEFVKALNDNIQKYEKRFGVVDKLTTTNTKKDLS